MMTTVIKAGQTGPILKRLTTVDLADHLAEAHAVVEEAKRRADEIVGQTGLERERVLEEARQSGYQAGYEQGRREGTDAGYQAAHGEATERFDRVHANLVADMRRAIGEICEGVTVDMTGETRSGRALGMGLLQVYARPGAELLVDEAPQGETPLIAVGVDAGPRDVRLRNAPLGYDCTFRLRVLPGTRYSILLDVKPELASLR